jgi:hypothetical protein
VLTKKVKAFLEAEHEELVHIWKRYIQAKQLTFYCDDMSFSIKKHSITDHLNEVYEDDIDRMLMMRAFWWSLKMRRVMLKWRMLPRLMTCPCLRPQQKDLQMNHKWKNGRWLQVCVKIRN